MHDPSDTTRRSFIQQGRSVAGTAALATLLAAEGVCEDPGARVKTAGATAKRIIYLFQSGAPSQLDLYDYKQGLESFATRIFPTRFARGSG